MDVKLKDLRYYLIPGEGVRSSERSIHAEAYRMWKQVWSETLLELDGNGKLYADDFSRQSMIGALFHQGECIGMTVFHQVHFDEPTAADDSYFKAWTPEALGALTSEGPSVLICSHLTIAKDWRKTMLADIPLVNMLSLLSTCHLLQTDCSVMTGTMRANRNAHLMAYATGATPILKDQQLHGVGVDLVGFYRSHFVSHPELHNHMWTQSLWRNRIEVGPREVTAVPNPARKTG